MKRDIIIIWLVGFLVLSASASKIITEEEAMDISIKCMENFKNDSFAGKFVNGSIPKYAKLAYLIPIPERFQQKNYDTVMEVIKSYTFIDGSINVKGFESSKWCKERKDAFNDCMLCEYVDFLGLSDTYKSCIAPVEKIDFSVAKPYYVVPFSRNGKITLVVEVDAKGKGCGQFQLNEKYPDLTAYIPDKNEVKRVIKDNMEKILQKKSINASPGDASIGDPLLVCIWGGPLCMFPVNPFWMCNISVKNNTFLIFVTQENEVLLNIQWWEHTGASYWPFSPTDKPFPLNETLLTEVNTTNVTNKFTENIDNSNLSFSEISNTSNLTENISPITVNISSSETANISMPENKNFSQNKTKNIPTDISLLYYLLILAIILIALIAVFYKRKK